MSSGSEENHSPGQLTEVDDEIQKKPKISYTRDFLLSLSDLDACKNLPSGFDQSLLSEFEDALLYRQRTSGGLSLNDFRRNEYGSSPPTRGDLTSHSRGIHGRWESRSSGRSDRDSDSQSERDSDSGKRYGNQSRRSWQVPEHDGLLGSGSFPRPSGYAAGASAPKVRPNEHYQLNKSSEPYQPPRPYKAVPHARRDTDSYNNETFGSSEYTSEDRAEEERKRRASFELMRKEQHRAFQDKQRSNLDKNKDDFDISTLVEEPKDETGSSKRNSEPDEFVKPLASDKDSEKSSVPAQAPAPRPLVPPGFASSVLDRSLGAKSLNHSRAAEVSQHLEVGNPESEDNLLHGKSKSAVNSTSEDQEQLAEVLSLKKQQHGSMSSHASINNQGGKSPDLSSGVDVSNILYDKTNIAQAFEASKTSEVTELNDKKVNGPPILGESNQDHSILDKLFGSALALNDTGSSVLERREIKANETQSPRTFQSSKFARWFHEEEKKPVNDQSSGRPNELLSLIVGGDKSGSRISGNKNEQSLPNLTFQNPENVDKLVISDAISVKVGSFDQLHKENKPEPVPAVLTCEDLEQSILSEINVNGPKSEPPPVQSWTDPRGKTEQPKANTDNLASLHLLSLLQKGTSLNDTSETSSNIVTSFSDNPHGIEEPSIGIALHNSREAKVEHVSDSGKTLTLETLFGSAFMKELQSVGAPVSSQKGPVGPTKVDGSDPHGFPFHGVDSLLPSSNETGFSTTVHDGKVLAVNKRKQTRVDKIEEPWLKFDDPQAEHASQLRPNYGSKVGGFNASADVRLPEEDSLITTSDPLALENFMPPGSAVKTDLLSSSNAQVELAEKLAAFNSAFRDERTIRGGQEPPFHRGPYDMRESSHPFQNQNVHPSFAQLQHQQLNNMGPLFPHLDSRPVNINSQMKFMAPEAVAHHDPAPNHQMPMNMLRPPFHHPSSGLSGFDQPIPHPLLQQMHMQGNLPPNVLQGLPRGPPMPAHPNRSAPMPAHPSFGSLGMPLPAPDVGGGSNHPEVLQRLIEMELRSNSKQVHPFAAGGQSHGTYGHELDMGFGFR